MSRLPAFARLFREIWAMKRRGRSRMIQLSIITLDLFSAENYIGA
jgi:hypothetical protein